MMLVPLYSYDQVFQGRISEQAALRLEREGKAKIVRHRKGRIARAIRFKRPCDPQPMRLVDYVGKKYSYKQHISDGHTPWALRPLGDRTNKHDQSAEYHLAPDCLRPIFLRVLLDCLVIAAA